MKNFKKNANFVILTFILCSYILNPVLAFNQQKSITNHINLMSSDSASDQIISDNNLKMTHGSDIDDYDISNWDDLIQKFDRDNDGLNDDFELNSNSLGKTTSLTKINRNNDLKIGNKIFKIASIEENQDNEDNINEKIPIIIHFEDQDYRQHLSLFESLGGNVLSTYTLINGFAGEINYDSLDIFRKTLKDNKISFLIEGNCLTKSNLYYVSRNMNLRPYVWKNLTYTGDYWSSIAIVDTGIDDSHLTFTNGYEDADFSKKIVGWADNLSTSRPVGYINSDTPLDDNFHGSHCAGIAAGDGFSYLGGPYITNATTLFEFDYTGFYTSPGYAELTLTKFEVTKTGDVEVDCNFTDYTPLDDIDIYAYLYSDATLVDSHAISDDNWEHILFYTAGPGDIGEHSVKLRINLVDTSGDGRVENFRIRFRGGLHFPFDPPLFESGDAWQGVAPNTHLVGVKTMNSTGEGWSNELLDGLEFIHNYRGKYNITVVSMSLGLAGTLSSVIDAVNNLVIDDGIVVVTAAGNYGAGPENRIFTPGDADYVITVAAMSNTDRVTSYSSSGGIRYNTIKPDIMAPGGSFNEYQVFSVDSNDNDIEGNYTDDGFVNDLYQASGTSMATPAVAGAANLLIEAMGGHQNWGYTELEAKTVKAILLMTATETYGLQRESHASYSPTLERGLNGGKDVHEGYGRINIDAAIEAWENDLSVPSKLINISVWLNTSQYNSYGKHAYAGFVNLVTDENVVFNLTVPDGADYDLYLYNNTPNEYGEPELLKSSISSAKGGNEIINYTATHDGKFFLVVKAIGEAIPSEGDDDDDDDDDKETVIDLTLFVIISAIVALIAIIIVIIVYKKNRKDYSYDYRPEY